MGFKLDLSGFMIAEVGEQNYKNRLYLNNDNLKLNNL